MKSLMIKLIVIAAFSLPTTSFSEDCNVNLPQGSGTSTLNSTLKCLNDKIQKLNSLKVIPVGTIVASMLKPDLFANIVGDPAIFDSSKSTWALADKRSVAGSTYSKKIDIKLPDLRGMFLRGMNEERNDGLQDPDNARLPGSTQKNQLREHTHTYRRHGHHNYKHADGGVYANAGAKEEGKQTDNGSNAKFVGKETRPNNVAVFYYIKIN